VLTPVSGHREQEPSPALGLVNPVFQDTGGSDVAVLVANLMCFARAGYALPVVVAQFMSALPPKADIDCACWDVRFVPEADSCITAIFVGVRSVSRP
jgi:hypothetical protein